MHGFAPALADSSRARIHSGRNIYDQVAAPLKSGLAGQRGYWEPAPGNDPVNGAFDFL
jgi:hypothetical protein